MPRIPLIEADTALPGQGGLPQSVQQVPSLPQPGIDQRLAGLVGQGFGALGESLTQITQLRQAQDRANELVQAKTRLQEFVLRYGQQYDQLREEATAPGQQGYLTLPDTAVEQGKTLLADFSEGLSPRAKAMFQEEALHQVGVVQQHAFGVRTKARDSQMQLLLARQAGETLSTALQADDTATREAALNRYADLLTQGVQVGLLHPGQAADAAQKVADTLTVSDVRRRIRLDWAGELTTLRAQAESGVLMRGVVPIADLITEAENYGQTQYRFSHETQQQQERQWSEIQKRNAAQVLGELAVLDPVPANVPTYRALLGTANAYAAMGVQSPLDPSSIERIQTTARSAINKALEPQPERNDPVTNSQVGLMVSLAKNTEDLDRAHDALVDVWGKLTAETARGYSTRIAELKRQTRVLTNPLYTKGQEIIQRAVLPVVGLIPIMTGMLQEEQKQQLQFALDSYEQRMLAIGRTDIGAMEQQAEPLAHEIRQTFFPATTAQLPQPLRDAADEQSMLQQLGRYRSAGMRGADLLELERQWRTYDAKRTADAQAASEATKKGKR